jgi:uncharacterized protein (TIGR00645 family)
MSPSPSPPRRSLETQLESGLFAGRWLMAPFYVGLLLALVLLLVVFLRELVEGVPAALQSEEQAILLVLSLVDLSLAGNLILIVTFSGYENFVSKMHMQNHVDRPAWMGAVDFSGMKLKLIGSIVAISAISLLRAFMQMAEADSAADAAAPDTVKLGWMIGLHITFVVSGVLFALMDWISEKSHRMAAHLSHAPEG